MIIFQVYFSNEIVTKLAGKKWRHLVLVGRTKYGKNRSGNKTVKLRESCKDKDPLDSFVESNNNH